MVGDHPHACGDKCLLLCLYHCKLGSSPRVWGQGKSRVLLPAQCRIIPTRVGTSELLYCCVALAKDHPHACGDKDICSPWTQQPLGSSPRVWGQESDEPARTSTHRIIPTRVGTSRRGKTRTTLRWDHPHACGDKK